MEIFPAIDLKDGKCVRLTQGDFATAIIYEEDPVKQAQKFQDAGAKWLHMVDLDGARVGAMQQFDAIAKVVASTKLNVQVGGGIRDAAIVAKLLDAGVRRVIIGSLAVKDQKLVHDLFYQFGAKSIVLAFDVRMNDAGVPEILTHGWQSGSDISLWDILDSYMRLGLKTILCTDVSRDGMLEGSNHSLYRVIERRYPTLDILASGGVDGIDDLKALSELRLAGAITGKATYEKRIDLAEAIKLVTHAG